MWREERYSLNNYCYFSYNPNSSHLKSITIHMSLPRNSWINRWLLREGRKTLSQKENDEVMESHTTLFIISLLSPFFHPNSLQTFLPDCINKSWLDIVRESVFLCKMGIQKVKDWNQNNNVSGRSVCVCRWFGFKLLCTLFRCLCWRKQ